MKKTLLFAGLALLSAALAPPAAAGTVRVKSLEFPRSPETVAIGEWFSVGVTVEYEGLQDAPIRIRFAYVDSPGNFQSGAPEVRLSGSGTHAFPPSPIAAPDAAHWPGGWPQAVNEWRLQAEIWQEGRKLGGRSFTVLVENPARTPSLTITRIEYVVPPDTIDVGEETLVKVHTDHANLDPNTRLEVSLSDSTGTLKTMTSQPLQPKGTRVFGLKITPRRGGQWVVEAKVKTINGSTPLSAKMSFAINVVSVP